MPNGAVPVGQGQPHGHAALTSGEVWGHQVDHEGSVEGDATALYLGRVLKPLGIRVTRLAHGVAVGTESEYADRVSLMRALENRREL